MNREYFYVIHVICLLKTLSKLLYYNEISYLFSRLEKKADSDQPRPIISVLSLLKFIHVNQSFMNLSFLTKK